VTGRSRVGTQRVDNLDEYTGCLGLFLESNGSRVSDELYTFVTGSYTAASGKQALAAMLMRAEPVVSFTVVLHNNTSSAKLGTTRVGARGPNVTKT
jgi:hypothetical protein